MLEGNIAGNIAIRDKVAKAWRIFSGIMMVV
jgi:hypothetical protein